jgi:hypothetical protein
MTDSLPETDLDEALAVAHSDKTKANYFYDALLNTELYVPVQGQDRAAGTWREVGQTEKFFPLFLKFEKGKAIVAFDSIERLKNWAGEKPLDYLKLQGYVLLQILSSDLFIILNMSTPWSYTLTPEILERLRSFMKSVTPQ